jgi:hypothetical protein
LLCHRFLNVGAAKHIIETTIVFSYERRRGRIFSLKVVEIKVFDKFIQRGVAFNEMFVCIKHQEYSVVGFGGPLQATGRMTILAD